LCRYWPRARSFIGDALGIEKTIFVGHDWGEFVTWGMPVLHHERVAGVAQNVRTIVSEIMRTAPPLEEVYALLFVDGKLNMNPFLDIESTPVLGQPLLSDVDFEHYVRPILSATVARFVTTGLVSPYSTVLRKYRSTRHDGAGLTATNGSIWILAA
jgi:pimeloyl-ACP methyl ester carboxylesterase